MYINKFIKSKIMKNSFIIFLLISHLFIFSQVDDSYNLDYNNSRNAAELCTQYKSSGFLSNAEADNALSKILSVVGASKRFIVAPCENINNALAIIDDGMRYILYDPEFINSISQTSNYWANMSILAHEVGHHINGHTLGASVSAYENKIQELESDEFSGFVMQKIGSTLDQATDAIASIASSGDDTYSSHPNKERRIKAITKGFNNAKNNNFITETKLTDWEEYYFRGNEKYDSEDYEGAIEDFSESIKLKPDANTYLNRGMSKVKIDDSSGAKSDFIRSIEINPTNWKPHYQLGRTLSKAGDHYGGLSALSTYFELVNYSGDYHDIWAGYYMAVSLYSEEIYNKSNEYIDYIITREDFISNIDAEFHHLFYRIRGQNNLALENFELAKKDLEKASGLDPDDAFSLELLGDTYAKEKNYKKAIEFYNQALILNSDSYSIYQYRAYAYEALEDYFNALLDMNEAIKHAPDFGYLYFKRGEYSFKIGDQKSACSDWLVGNEKGDTDSFNKLIETCGYSKEDFYSSTDFFDASVEEKDKGNYIESLRLLDKCKEIGFDDTSYLKSAYYSTYYKSGKYDLALGVLSEMLVDISEDDVVWWNKQFLYTNFELENWSQLTIKCKELISQYTLDPDALDNSVNLTFIKKETNFVYQIFDTYTSSLSKKGEYEKALIITGKFMKLGKVLENNDFIKTAYLGNGVYKMESGDYLGALQDINEYIKLTEEWSSGYLTRGKIKLRMSDAYSKYACGDFNLALEVSQKNENEDEEAQQEIQKFIDDNCK